MHYRLLTLGRFALVGPGGDDAAVLADAKPLAVLAVLAWEGPLRPEQVTELLWPDATRDRATASLRQALYTLSQAAGTPLVERDDGHLALDTDRLTVDLTDFREGIQDGDHEWAIRLYRGHFLGGYEAVQDRRFVQWAESVDDWVEVHLQQAYDQAVEASLRAEDMDRAVKLAEGFRAHFPLVTQAVDCLVITLRAAGRLRAALAEIQLFEQRLEHELGEPLPEELEDLRAVLEAELRNELSEVGEEVREAGVGVEAAVSTSPIMKEQAEEDRADVLPSVSWRSSQIWRAGAVGLVIVAAALAAVSSRDRDVAIEIPVRSAGAQALAVLDPTGVTVSPEPTEGRRSIRSPRGVWARNVVTRQGTDIDLEYPDGERRRILHERADEVPLDWSPDGRYLLYLHIVATPEPPGFRARAGVWDTEEQTGRILYEPPDVNIDDKGVWSPDGERIALVEIDRDDRATIVVVGVDGRVRTRIGDGSLDARAPAWSPDGLRLAFVGTRDDQTDIHIVHRDGSNLKRIGIGPASERSPVWLSDRHVAAMTDGPQGRLVILSTEGAEAASVAAPEITRIDVQRMDHWPDRAAERVSLVIEELARVQEAASPAVWFENVTIDGSTVLSPGEYATFRLKGKDPQGRSSAMLPPAVEWTAEDSSVLRPLEGGRYRALRTGTTRIHAAVPGWPGDTLQVHVREPRVRSVPVLLRESWIEGLDPDRWSLFGDPLPRVETHGGPEGGGTFDSRGDANLNSGAVSLDSFPLAGGLTVEYWARIVPTGDAYQQLAVGLMSGDPTTRDQRGLPEGSDLLVVRLLGTDGVVEFHRDPNTTAPLPDGIDSWRRVAIQVQPDGTSAFLVDGRVYLRNLDPIPLDQPVHVSLFGRSQTTTVLHGPVTVYGGARYEIDR